MKKYIVTKIECKDTYTPHLVKVFDDLQHARGFVIKDLDKLGLNFDLKPEGGDAKILRFERDGVECFVEKEYDQGYEWNIRQMDINEGL